MAPEAPAVHATLWAQGPCQCDPQRQCELRFDIAPEHTTLQGLGVLQGSPPPHFVQRGEGRKVKRSSSTVHNCLPGVK